MSLGWIDYAEFDGVAVCIFHDGTWCKRAAGHEGPHVLRPSESSAQDHENRSMT